jgi:ATP-dependent DNA ligase
MSADKRKMEDYKEFDGQINENTFNYEFPTLYVLSDKNQLRKWNIYVRLIKTSSKKPVKTKTQNWNLLLEDQVPIKKEYLENTFKLPDGLVAQIWTESGIIDMKISRYPPTYTTIKNKGKKNERSSFQQALITARGKYLKKKQEGFNTNIPNKLENNGTKSKNKQNIITDKKYFPMLAKNYKDVKIIEYPVYVQPKLDGLRCLVYLYKNPDKHPSYKDIVLYTRQKKEYPENNITIEIKKSVFELLKNNYDKLNNESLYLDGELYKHGVSLQNLNSFTRNSDLESKETGEYHIYDIFYPSYTDEPFSYRTEFLKTQYNKYVSKDFKKVVKLVPTHYVKTKKESDNLYKCYLDKNYEGTMIRIPGGKYCKSNIKKSSSLRSKNLLKRKEVYDGEFEVINFTQGSKGKDIGACIWICITKDNLQFNVVPNLSYKERYDLYKDCLKNFVDKYKNRMLTIEYRSLTDDGIPSHARGILFRTY